MSATSGSTKLTSGSSNFGPGSPHSLGDVLPAFEDSDFYLQPEDVKLSEQIGAGAFSKVYVGMYLGELVAVKKQKRAAEDNLEAYLMRELAVLKHFEHPNLLNYIGASKVPSHDGTKGDIYIVTELAECGDLLGLLLGDALLGWQLRTKILMDAALALEFLHSRSLIHRDIKSPNMLLCKGYRCKLADFGMARQLGEDMTIVGTDAYMAPELMFDDPYDTAADMFSFGIVVWECIHRKKAGADGFAERRPSDRFVLDQDELANRAPEDTPNSLIMLATQLCSYEPYERPTAEDTFMWLEDLTSELDPDTVPLPEPIDFEQVYFGGAQQSITPKAEEVTLSFHPRILEGDEGENDAPIPKPKRTSSLTTPPRLDVDDHSTSSPSLVSPSGGTRGAAHHPITCSGYLFKKGKKGMRSWQKRWFVLEGSRLIWYKDSKHYPREPRGYLELRGCFLIRGIYFRWKILSADSAADQEDYNRELAAADAGAMEQWLKALQQAIDEADSDMSMSQTKPPMEAHNHHDRILSISSPNREAFRTDESMAEWLEVLGLERYGPAFEEAGYTDTLMILEMGLRDDDLDAIGIKDPPTRKVLKLHANGGVEPILYSRVTGYFNFGKELVYKIESKWRYLRACTFFRYQDFEELHKKLRASMKDTRLARFLPQLPAKPPTAIRGLNMGSIDHATVMARLQVSLNKYIQKLVALVGNKEPYFTMLCGQLDLLPPDHARLPEVQDMFIEQLSKNVGDFALK